MRIKTLELRLDQLRLEGGGFINPRRETGLDKAAIRELALDIKERGLTDPLTVWAVTESDKPAYVIVDGQRRYLALQLLREEGVRLPALLCTIREGTLLDIRFDVLAKYLHRKEWSNYELAEEIVSVRKDEPAINGKEIAARLHISPALVSRVVQAYDHASDKLKEVWRKGQLPSDVVYDIARSVPIERQEDTIKSFAIEQREGSKNKRKLSAQLRKKVKSLKGENPRPSRAEINVLLEILAEVPDDHDYLLGVRETLRYVLGDFWDPERGEHDLDRLGADWSDYYASYRKLLIREEDSDADVQD